MLMSAPAAPARWNQSSVWKALQVSKSMNSKWTQQDLLYAIELVRQGMPIKPAAEQCNIPVMTLWRRTRALGVFSSRAASGYRPAPAAAPDPGPAPDSERPGAAGAAVDKPGEDC